MVKTLIAGSQETHPVVLCGEHGSGGKSHRNADSRGPRTPAPGHMAAENDLSQAPSLIMHERCLALSTVEETAQT